MARRWSMFGPQPMLCSTPWRETSPGRIIGVVLTGMGRDGARGMAAIKDRGGYVLAQDEETSTIFSMPKAVIEEGAAHEVLPLGEIAPAIKRLLHV